MGRKLTMAINGPVPGSATTVGPAVGINTPPGRLQLVASLFSRSATQTLLHEATEIANGLA